MIIIPIYILLIIIFGLIKKVDCFSSFIEGAKEGLLTAYNLFPTIIGLIFAINIFINSGIINLLSALFNNPDLCIELFLQAFIRPLSANSSLIIMNQIYQTYGANSVNGQISSLIQGCSDTTLYVVTVYYGYLNIKKTSYVIIVGLITDIVTFILAIILGNLLF